MPRLSKGFIDKLKPQAKEIVFWDSDLPGYGIRVRASGRKTFIIQYRNSQGRTRKLTVGAYGRLTPDQARSQAKILLARVEMGQDPAEIRRAGRQAPTFAELAERYIQEHALPKKKPRSITLDRQMLNNQILPALGNMRADAVTRQDVNRIHHSLRDTPYQANRVLALLSKIFNLAETWGLRPDGTNPCHHVEKFKERKRERYLSQDELASLGQVLTEAESKKEISPTAAAALRLLALTGMRVGEVLSLQWDWVDFQRGVIFFPDSKAGQKVTVLGGPALELLSNIPKTAGNTHVFAGKKFGRPLVDINGPWRLVREKAGLKGVRLHDLRHTHASVGAAAGLSLPVIGAMLGHTQAATTQRYAHLAQDPVKQAADKVASLIDGTMKAPAKQKVVDIGKDK